MENQMKGFWKFFGLMIAGGVVSVIGGVIGKTAVGYSLFFLGLAAVLAGLVFCIIKRSYFKKPNFGPLVLGLAFSLLLTSSVFLLVSNTGGTFKPTGSSTSFTRQFSRITNQGSGSYGSFSGRSGNGSFPGGSFGTGGSYSGNRNWSGNSSSQNSTFSTIQAAMLKRKAAMTLVGWFLLGVGALLLLIFGIRLLTKKTNFGGGRWQTLLLGVLIGVCLASASSLMLTRRVSAHFVVPTANGQTLPQGTPNGTMMPPSGPEGQSTETATPAPTMTVTSAPTSTPKATVTATAEIFNSLVVCLDYNRQTGINVRDFPSDTANIVGTIPAAGCFTVDGQNAQYAGWYHMATGQNGIGGIQIPANDQSPKLWVDGKHLSTLPDQLAKLPQVDVVAP